MKNERREKTDISEDEESAQSSNEDEVGQRKMLKMGFHL